MLSFRAMTQLSVNVNKLATLRNARGKNSPNVERMAQDILDYGAHGITIHPRPDGRHIRLRDVHILKGLIVDYRQKRSSVELNIEGYPSPEFLQLMLEVSPDQCTLVPDPPDVLTSNAGWSVAAQRDLLQSASQTLHEAGVRISLFIDPYNLNDLDLKALQSLPVQRAELYTEAYAEAHSSGLLEPTLKAYRQAADQLLARGLELNAGHDLNQKNLAALLKALPEIREVSIGHALVCEALEEGMQTTIKNYLNLLSSLRA